MQEEDSADELPAKKKLSKANQKKKVEKVEKLEKKAAKGSKVCFRLRNHLL